MDKFIDVAGSVFDVDDREYYRYLDPVWELLENTPDKGITSKVLWEQTGLDADRGNVLLKDLANEFMQKVMDHITRFLMHPKELTHSWAFDKVMLLTSRVDDGSGVTIPDNMAFRMLRKEWLKQRGM